MNLEGVHFGILGYGKIYSGPGMYLSSVFINVLLFTDCIS